MSPLPRVVESWALLTAGNGRGHGDEPRRNGQTKLAACFTSVCAGQGELGQSGDVTAPVHLNYGKHVPVMRIHDVCCLWEAATDFSFNFLLFTLELPLAVQCEEQSSAATVMSCPPARRRTLASLGHPLTGDGGIRSISTTGGT